MEHPEITHVNRTGYPSWYKHEKYTPIESTSRKTICGCNRRIGKHYYGKQLLCTQCAIEGGFIIELADIY